MAEQPDSSTTEATQSKQTTRFQYPRGDAVIGEFFTANVYKSAALIDVIYLFHLDYGVGADVSQILRERLMEAARSGSGDTTPTPPATKRTVDMLSDTEPDAVSNETAVKKQPEKTAEKTVEKKQQKAETESEPEQQSNTDEKSSDFDIAEMFD